MQKVNKWITQKEYVDQQTGEVISEWKAKNKYVIILKTKHIQYESSINRNTHNRETIGIITYTIECGRNGSQIKLWE